MKTVPIKVTTKRILTIKQPRDESPVIIHNVGRMEVGKIGCK